RRRARIPAPRAAFTRLSGLKVPRLGVDSCIGMKAGGAKAAQTLRDLFSKEKAARGFDINLARKAAMGGWLVGAVVGYGLTPFYPPTAQFGSTGWVVAGSMSLFTLLWMGVLLRRPERVTRDTLLVTAYLGIVYVAVAQWLAGGLPAPYHELYPF